ncbi:MAG: DEAD/DEAH box helicase [Polyangiales bacterium]
MSLIAWQRLDPRGWSISVTLPDVGVAHVFDFYCPLPECDCRRVALVARSTEDNQQHAGVEHFFARPPHGRPQTALAVDLQQGPDAALWLMALRAQIVDDPARAGEYERRYWEVKAAAVDPLARGHSLVRGAAGMPVLPIPTPERVKAPSRRAKAPPTEPPPADDDATLRALLGARHAADHLTGSDLLAAAMALCKPHRLTAEKAVAVLADAGLAVNNPARLAERIAQSVRDAASFARLPAGEFGRLPKALLERRVRELLQRREVRDLLVRRPPVASAAPAASAAPVASAAPAPAAPAPAAPKAPAAPSLPEAPAFAPAARALPTLDVARFAAVLASPPSPLGAVALALDAQRLASAAQFDELLAVATMRDVVPHRYQTETVRRVLRALRGRGILADEVGLGKTVEAMMVLREYQVRGMARRALVLAPASLVPQWAGELAQKAGVAARTTDDPRAKDDPEGFWSGPGVVVASLSLARAARHAPVVQAHPWDVVIVDEAHHIKNRATMGYKLVVGLKQRFLLLVTATPVENDLEEIYNLVTLLRPGQFDTPAAFRKRFVDPKDPTRPKDREALRALLAEVMVRNTRAQSGLALPPRFVTTVAVPMSDDERALYAMVLAFVRIHHEDAGLQLAATSLLLEAGSSPRAVRATVARMREKAKGADKKEVREKLGVIERLATAAGASGKAAALLQVVAARREPALVFTRYRETLDEVVAAVERAGVAAVAFHGGLDAREKAAALERFRAGGAVVMVATAAGSEGHNLQHCNVLVNYDLPWNPMAIEQRIGRLHRMGQTREVHVYNLCSKDTIEERVLDVLDRRVQLFQLVVGEMDMVLGNLAEERDLEDWLVQSVARAKTDAEVDATFDRLAAELLAARGRYEKTRSLDEALFGGDFEA